MSAEVESWLNFALAVGMVAAGLGFVIFVHELGHFLAAKACGVKAEKFYVGFDIPMPKIFGWQIPSTLARFQWGETEYGIGILPLGGYVKMLGQDDDPRKYKEEQGRAKAAAENIGVKEEEAPAMASFDSSFNPRSYQAKSVPQRMLIISAGVIMNLIFAVIMGAVAYGIGVPYVPTVIGQAPAGTTGWVQDLRPGDKVIRIGENGRVSEAFRWEQDLLPKILLSSGEPVELLIQRPGREEPFEVVVQGVKRPDSKFALLGIKSLGSTQIAGRPKVERMAAAQVEEMKPGDRIIAVNGSKIDSFADLQFILASQPDEPLELTLERKTKETGEDGKPSEAITTLTVTLPPQPQRTLGLVMKTGAISAVRKNSPAENAGIKAGDKLVSIDGQPLGDPFTLSQRLLKYVGQKDVPVEIVRTSAGGKQTTLTKRLTPTPPIYMEDGVDPYGGDQVALEPLGIALPVLSEVASVVEGSPADKAGVKPGDDIEGVQFVTEDKVDAQRLEGSELLEQMTLDLEGRNWAFIHHALQEMPASVEVNLTFRRDGKLLNERLKPVNSEEGYFEPRGLELTRLQEIRTAESAGEAVALGFRETKEKLMEVAATLRALLTGKISARNTGGPIMIAQVAYMEASQGWGRLLIFLTFLSANLALINFLPIPVLDGGHMVFLAAEGIRGKPVDEHVQYYALLVGAAMLLCLMVFVFSNDIINLIT